MTIQTDDILEIDHKKKLQVYLENWIKTLISNQLEDLVNLNKIEKKKFICSCLVLSTF